MRAGEIMRNMGGKFFLMAVFAAMLALSCMPQPASALEVGFGSNTAQNNSAQPEDYIFVNASANDTTSNISAFIDFDDYLVSWWRMDDVNGTGHPTDYMNRNNGTKFNDANQTSSGYLGKGFSFDGDNDYFRVTDMSDHLPTVDYSLCWWTKPNILALKEVILLGTNNIDHDFEYYQNSGTLNVRANYGSGVDINIPNAFVVGQWVHICGMGNSSGTFVYINGVYNASTVYTKNITAGYDLNIGAWATGQYSFNGTMDDIMIFNRSLAAAEVRALYANQISQYPANNFTGLDAGTHTFRAYVQDDAGNLVTTGERTVKVTGIKDCTTLDMANTVYTLQNDLSATGNCLTVGADNITIDGNGYDMTGNGGSYGITDTGSRTNITIRNFGDIDNFLRGVSFTDVNDVRIINNTMTSSASGAAYAIYLEDGDSNEIRNNTIQWEDYGVYVESNGNFGNNILINNSFDISGSSTVYGIYMRNDAGSMDPNIISDNDIVVDGSTAHGVYLFTSGGDILNSTINNNNLRVEASTHAYGIYLKTDIGILNSTEVYDNFINITANSKGHGIELYNKDEITSNTLKNNTIFVDSVAEAYGIYFYCYEGSVSSNSLEDNTLDITSASDSYGVYEAVNYGSFDSLTINNNTIDSVSTGGDAYGINLYGYDHNISFVEINTSSSSSNAYDFYLQSNSFDVTLSDSMLFGTNYSAYVASDSGPFTLLNVSYSGAEAVESGGELIRKWYYSAYINDTNGNDVANANVSQYVDGVLTMRETANSTGWISQAEVTAYKNIGGTITEYNYLTATNGTSVENRHFYNASAYGNYFSDIITIDVEYPAVSFGSSTTQSGKQTAEYIFVNVSANDSIGNVSIVINFDNSIIGWWRMDDVDANGDPTDYFGNYDGSTVNGPAQTDAGYFGKGFEFDGQNDFIRVGSIAKLAYYPFTFSAWVNGDDGVIVSTVRGSARGSHDIRLENGIAKIHAANNSIITGDLAGNINVSEGWHHIVGVFENDTSKKLYVDGNYDTKIPVNTTKSSSAVYVGIGATGVGFTDFGGTIDDVIIFNRTLSAAEIAGLYANASSKYSINNFTNLTNGDHTFRAYAQDTAGNMNATETRSVRIGINSCKSLDQANKFYLLIDNVATAGTCFNMTASGITFDCDDYIISGNQSGYGIAATDMTGLTARNCFITNFSRAVSLQNTSSSTFDNLTMFSNNGDYSGIYAELSNSNSFSNSNFSSNNASDNSGIYFYDSDSNEVVKNSISSGSSSLVYLASGSDNNTFQDMALTGNANYHVQLVSVSADNTFLNVSYNLSKENVSPGCELIRKWYFSVWVVDMYGKNVSSIPVTIYNRTSDQLAADTTNPKGMTGTFQLIDYINTGTRNEHNNHTIEVGPSIFFDGLRTRTVNITASMVFRFEIPTPHILQLILKVDSPQERVYIPGIGVTESNLLTNATYFSPTHWYLASYLNNNLKALVFTHRRPYSMQVNNTSTGHLLTLSQELQDSKSFIVFTSGDWTTINNRMGLVENGQFLNEITPSFAHALNTLHAIKIMLSYTDIDILDDMVIQRGSHKIYIKKEGESGPTTMLDISLTG